MQIALVLMLDSVSKITHPKTKRGGTAIPPRFVYHPLFTIHNPFQD